MIVHEVQQGSREWLKLRAGIPTASEFDRLVTPGGKASSAFDGYLYAVLAGRMTGLPDRDFKSAWMERGNQLEAEAVAFYEFQRDVETQPVGFITDDLGRYGASPDCMVGEIGMLECKCPSPAVHMGYLLGKGVDGKYLPQLQGQLLVTGRQWVDILSYHPELPSAIVRVERDEAMIALLEDQLGKFCRLLDNYEREIRERFPEIARQQEPAPEYPMGLTAEDLQWAMDRGDRFPMEVA